MKRLSQLVAWVLALATLLSSLCVTAFADNSEVDISRFSEGTGYLAFGDSITRGYGASDKWDDEGYLMDNTNNSNCRNVTGSYTKILADAIGCYCPDNILDKDGEYWPIAQDAVTTAYLLDFLGIEDNYYDSEYAYSYSTGRTRYNTLLHYFGTPQSMNCDGQTYYGKEGEAVPVDDLIANSSLITICIGMGDVLNRARSLATWDLEDDLSDPAVLSGALKTLVVKMYEGYRNWKENYPLILDYFKEHTREDAAVVLVGCINPVFNMNITDEYLYPVGSALSAITAMMNRQYKQWAKEYGFIYVDISNVETGSTESDVGLLSFLSAPVREQGLATHPTAAGYQQIARLIIAALQEHEATQKSCKTDIRVDLGRIKSVSGVFVNGKSLPASSYTVKNSVLTIPYHSTFAKSLTVTSAGSSGDLALTTYQLSYHRNEGYSAYRIYTTNHAGTVVKSAAKNIVGVVTGLFSLLKK